MENVQHVRLKEGETRLELVRRAVALADQSGDPVVIETYRDQPPFLFA